MISLSPILQSFPATAVRLRQAAALAVATCFALGLAETGARIVRRDAFPFLNLFLADETFGVRLQPNACAALRLRSGRVSRACTDAHGFRITPEAPLAEKTVVVVGDSQVFGYAVADDETLPAQLQAKLGPQFQVLNRGVPTWGPREYFEAVKEQARRGQVDHVVLVINAANDFFEINVSNQRRTTASDGWAQSVRSRPSRPAPELVPTETQWTETLWATLLQRSQLIFLVRRLLSTSPRIQAPRSRAAQLLVRDVNRLTQRAAAIERPSVLAPAIDDMQAFCDEHGCELTVVVLPIDVQVDPTAWSKYASDADRPASPTKQAIAERLPLTLPLLDGVVDAARGAGAKAIGFHALAAADTAGGLFLPDDDHLSARGHSLLAEALARQLSSPISSEHP